MTTSRRPTPPTDRLPDADDIRNGSMALDCDPAELPRVYRETVEDVLDRERKDAHE